MLSDHERTEIEGMMPAIRARSAEYERASSAINGFVRDHRYLMNRHAGKSLALYVFAFDDKTVGIIGPDSEDYYALLDSNVKRRCITRSISL